MMSIGFWFAAGVCLFIICAYGCYVLGKSLAKVIGAILLFAFGIWFICNVFEFMQVLVIIAVLGLYLCLIIYCIYKAYRQIRYYKVYELKYHIILAICFIVLLLGHYVLPFIVYGFLTVLGEIK